jgi:hypothetical protein
MKLEVMQQRAKPNAHVEIGVQIELESGEYAFFCTGSSTDAAVAFEHGNAHPCARQIGGKR